MNPRQKLRKFTAIFALVFAAAVANAGTETHGGQTIPKDGQEWLKDLVDSATCVWVKGSDFSSELEGYPEIIAKIEKANPYLGNLFAQQAKSIRVCVTEQPLRLVPNSTQNIFVPFDDSGNQVAVRTCLEGDSFDTVFIDKNIYKAIPSYMKPYLWIHEQLHGMIPEDVPLRYVRLKSFVKFLFSKRFDESLEPTELLDQVEATRIDLKGIGNALIQAIRKGDDTLAAGLLAQGANVNTSGALLIAASKGASEITHILLPLANLVRKMPASLRGLMEHTMNSCNQDAALSDLYLTDRMATYHLPNQSYGFASLMAASCVALTAPPQQREQTVAKQIHFLSSVRNEFEPFINERIPSFIDDREPARHLLEILVISRRPEFALYFLNEYKESLDLSESELRRIYGYASWLLVKQQAIRPDLRTALTVFANRLNLLFGLGYKEIH